MKGNIQQTKGELVMMAIFEWIDNLNNLEMLLFCISLLLTLIIGLFVIDKIERYQNNKRWGIK